MNKEIIVCKNYHKTNMMYLFLLPIWILSNKKKTKTLNKYAFQFKYNKQTVIVYCSSRYDFI